MSRRTSIGSVLTLPYFPLPALWSLRGKLLDGDTPYPGRARKREVCANNGVLSGNLRQTMVKLIIISDRGFYMEKEKIPLDVQTIRAAVAGEKWAVEKVIEHYSGEIDRLCMITKKQLDVSFKKVVDEDMRQALITKLIEALPQFETEK